MFDSIHKTLTTLGTLALATGLLAAAPAASAGTAFARPAPGVAPVAAPIATPEAAPDQDQVELFVTAGVAAVGLAEAYDSGLQRGHTMTVFTEGGYISATYGPRGNLRQLVGAGDGLKHDLDVALAVETYDPGPLGSPQIARFGDLVVDIEYEVDIDVIGVVDVIIDAPYLDAGIYVDPQAGIEDMLAMIEFFASIGMCGACSEKGYEGEMCDSAGGTITGCYCPDMVDPQTGSSNGNPQNKGSNGGGFWQRLWDALKDLAEGDDDSGSSQDGDEEETEEGTEEAPGGETIAPWSEGPMMLTQSDVYRIIGRYQDLLDPTVPIDLY